jgi:ATP-dependent helicase/nuclease subunit A
MSLTSAQQEAIVARGNVLVIAGAGTGKTRTLVERCLNCLITEKPPVSIDELLMVTFTEAAAAEMRLRIRHALEKESAKEPRNARWREQLALFETAHIGTLHSFCFQLVRQHFYELELDPQLSVLPEEEARLLAEETLEALLRDHYAGRAANAEAVQQLIQTHGHGSDKPIRALVLRLHHYTQTLPSPGDWLRHQLALFASAEPVQWRDWLRGALAEWPSRWLPFIAQLEAQNGVAANCAALLRSWPAGAAPAEAAALLERLESAIQNCSAGKVTAWVKPLKEFRSEAEFLSSLVSQAGPGEPLAEDWAWIRPDMTALLRLAQEFGQAYSEAKRELGGVDFHDLEQHALRLLWDAEQNQPTKIAAQWRQKLRFVFVDEYQDINAAQDKIIEAISRGGAQANRFLVGDVKQSIYRFRLANPSIFRGYAEKWRDGQGQALPLAENFRSREGVLDFINSLFELIMRRQMGGVEYDEQARLRFGAPAQRRPLSVAAAPAPRVELHFRVRGQSDLQEMDEEASAAMVLVGELEEAEKEARLVALRLNELKAEGHLIWDETTGQFRPAQWSDIAVLLRSPSNKSESYAKEFARANIPLVVARGGFYKSTEVSDLLSLLQLLDNPLQDIPALAVLHSPLVGLNLNELAEIRLARLKVRFWTALREWAGGRGQRTEDGGQRTENREQATDNREQRTENSGAAEKVSAFLERFGRWRRLARQASLSRCLEAVLQETHYAAWLLTQPRGEQRHANVQRLLGLAQRFDQFQRHGLFRFLRFIEAQQIAEIEPEVPSVCEENSVRLMSIHQSKGLEFPVVVLADLGKSFNVSDLRADIILDEQYGLCPQVKPPHTG